MTRIGATKNGNKQQRRESIVSVVIRSPQRSFHYLIGKDGEMVLQFHGFDWVIVEV
jgi:hypothetical protein